MRTWFEVRNFAWHRYRSSYPLIKFLSEALCRSTVILITLKKKKKNSRESRFANWANKFKLQIGLTNTSRYVSSTTVDLFRCIELYVERMTQDCYKTTEVKQHPSLTLARCYNQLTFCSTEYISVTLATVQSSLAFTPDLTHRKQEEKDPGWTKAPHWPRVIWKMDSGVLFHEFYATITNSQPHKKRMLLDMHFNQSLALILLQRSCANCIVRKRTLNQNKNTNVITYKNAGNFPYFQNVGP